MKLGRWSRGRLKRSKSLQAARTGCWFPLVRLNPHMRTIQLALIRWTRVLYLRYIHPTVVWVVAPFWRDVLSLEDTVLEAITGGENKVNLGVGNLNQIYSSFLWLVPQCARWLRVVTKGTTHLRGYCCLCRTILLPLLPSEQHTQSNRKFHWRQARFLGFQVSD